MENQPSLKLKTSSSTIPIQKEGADSRMSSMNWETGRRALRRVEVAKVMR